MNMKLVVLCLLAVCCSSLANTSTNEADNIQLRKLKEVLRHLNDVKKILQLNDQMLNTPQNITDCCYLSALKCFRDNLHLNVAERKQHKLYRSLRHNITESGLDFCSSNNVKPTCQDCESHPKENATIFFNSLESLFQRAILKHKLE